MTKNLFRPLLWGILLVFIFYGCRTHDEVIQQDKELQGSEYVSKSLWKEDEKYIKNIKAIFEKNADLDYFHSKNGVPYWNYATTIGVFNESFLEVPIIKNKTVAYIMVAERLADNKVYFRRKDNPSSNDFFNLLIFKDRSELNGKILSDNLVPSNSPIGTMASTGSMTCYTIQVTWTWSDEQTGEVLSTSTTSETRCQGSGAGYYPAIPSECLTENCEPSYDYGGGAPFPDTPIIDPCTQAKTILSAGNVQKVIQALKDKVNYVYNPVNTNNKGEDLHVILKNGDVKIIHGEQDHVKFSPDIYTKGSVHDHDSKGYPMFPPQDINSFISTVRVQNYPSDPNDPTDKTGEAFLGIVTPDYNYFMLFNGTKDDIPPMYGAGVVEAFQLESEKDTYILKVNNITITEEILQKKFFENIDRMGLSGKINLIKQVNGNNYPITKEPDGSINNNSTNPCKN
ncbi:hypothetical protein M2T82_12525 [Elizabethkingia ursingii]|uniref:hypothetical protein n=1 Tax=Elizabethkingia ursingii TaxID=1756150 RepID=UPI00201298AF|nr:hypothetical protein [Elizabethkingia ursingii]MCL1668890.1 hypothetical protein [Elizabethkingia ursingii]